MLLITRSDTQIREDIHKSREMDCLNERCSHSIGKLRKNWKRVWAKDEWGRGQTMTRWHLRKADFCCPLRKKCSQSAVKGKRGNERMWVGERRGESTLYSLGCQFTSKPSQPPTSQSCLKGCFGCRVPTRTYRQTEWAWDLPDESTFNTDTH